MEKSIVLNKQEKDNLLSEINSRDMYNAVLAFIDTVKLKDNRPYPRELYRTLAEKAAADAKAGVNYTDMEDMRKLFPG
ncbi:MAG: hypothetical protein LBB62_02770 [Proteiniphilum sp.]|jgi:hypothetical protein|nr:hypothetical protein [Proteiniphilum sp.]